MEPWSGERARKLRLTTGIGQYQWGRLLGVSRPTVARWEAGGTPPQRLRLWLQLLNRAVPCAQAQGWSLARTLGDKHNHGPEPWYQVMQLVYERGTETQPSTMTTGEM